MNNDNDKIIQNEAQYLAEIAIANLATGFQMLAKNRIDLAAYFFAEAAKKGKDAQKESALPNANKR